MPATGGCSTLVVQGTHTTTAVHTCPELLTCRQSIHSITLHCRTLQHNIAHAQCTVLQLSALQSALYTPSVHSCGGVHGFQTSCCCCCCCCCDLLLLL
jgi:hypothetical protein